MFGEEDFDQFKILIKLPEGTSLEETNRIVKKFESEALKLSDSELEAVIVNVGLMQGNNEWLTRKNVAQVLFQLKPREERDQSTEALMNRMRERTAYISGTTSVEFEMVSGGPPVGKPISVKVQGKYLDEIKHAALALKDSIRAMPGTFDVSDDFPPGKDEIRIIVDEEKAALYGFSTQYVALNVRYAFDGIEVTEYREGDEEIDVIVKYNRQNRSELDDVLHLRLNNSRGQTVALGDMVKFEIKTGPDEIKRFDQKRTIIVSGEINEDETTLDNINYKLLSIFPKMEKQFSGISFKIGGQFEEFMNIFSDITSLFILSLILIFLILGTQFNSYSQPLIILTTVPFALIGAMLGLIISGNPFSVVALYGFVALAGIVVNDAIVMITFINARRAGKETTKFQYWRSIINGGRVRLRPIILTSVTTISGLLPMALGIGGTSEMWSPLANVIMFGLLFSTILTLFVIPALNAVLDDIKGSRKKAAMRIDAVVG
jgi:multidrug efflux pump subunit AcrB